MRTKIIAEIGANHCGRMDLAEQLVVMAHEAGCDAVKGQLRDMDSAPDWWATKPYGGPNSYGETYLEHRRALELSEEQYRDLGALAHSLGMEWGCSVWDVPSVARAVRVGCDWVKIPSAKLTDPGVRQACLATRLPIIASCGMSTRDEVLEAIKHLSRCEDLTLLVCTSTYPCANEDANLLRLLTLREVAPFATVGVSGHWRGVQLDSAAVALGAQVIERHITLDRTMRGTDHAASLEPHGLEVLVRDVRAVEAALGSPALRLLQCEEGPRSKLR
jgi:N-acetylneuraminate synthase